MVLEAADGSTAGESLEVADGLTAGESFEVADGSTGAWVGGAAGSIAGR
jgi:hypothetical protein